MNKLCTAQHFLCCFIHDFNLVYWYYIPFGVSRDPMLPKWVSGTVSCQRTKKFCNNFCVRAVKLFSFLFHLARPFCRENTISSIRVASFYSADLGMIRNSVQTFSKRSDWAEHFWSALNYSSIIFVNTWNHWLVTQRSVFSHWWPIIDMTQQPSRESFIQLKFPWVIQSL